MRLLLLGATGLVGSTALKQALAEGAISEVVTSEKEINPMKLIEFDQFGGPEVLQFRNSPEPQLRPNDLLIRTHAAGVNRADLTLRRGGYGRPNFGDSETMGLEMRFHQFSENA